MKRIRSTPRANWRATVETQGLTYAVDRGEDGAELAYWHEDAAYELTEREVDHLEQVTQELHDMSVQAAHVMLADESVMARLNLPEGATEYLARSLADTDETSIYGRFDLVWDGTGHPKMLEYNADTPAGLVEAAVCQWMWLEDLHPDRDQWNMLHERFLATFADLKARGQSTIHFAVGQDEPTEDWATVAYLIDTATEAGVTSLGITMEEIGFDHGRSAFIDGYGRDIGTCFKMYPTEWMLEEDFGQYVMGGQARTRWIEPAWKTLLGSKALLPVLWDMFPGHPNLLPSYFDHSHDMDRYVTKPMYGWEGAGIGIHAGSIEHTNPVKHTEGQQVIYQEYVPLPVFSGSRPVLGTWVVGGKAAGLGIRESDGLVTDTGARFVPHLMTTPRSTPQQVAAWLAS